MTIPLLLRRCLAGAFIICILRARRALAGTWLGLKLYGRIDEATFRKIVLALLFVSGAVLILPRF
jgi:uncharacterized membrane protein YfcA